MISGVVPGEGTTRWNQHFYYKNLAIKQWCQENVFIFCDLCAKLSVKGKLGIIPRNFIDVGEEVLSNKGFVQAV